MEMDFLLVLGMPGQQLILQQHQHLMEDHGTLFPDLE
jgi:hypothetical protein